ncbi:MAG: Na(+)-translocating NADH-quinone reductase subunit F [Flaviramulus sp.]|nr:Na(+)-translocating NADH-quinone reductase subunit F [Flaviramulus sp.]NNC49756.1 Na(+)-translocating NADH-quinone reductase subunit F [Flaviramulus sp.]
MSKALTEQELHNLAMNHVGKDLEDQGFEFITINNKLQKHPQFICVDKDNQYYYVIVQAVKLPFNPYKYNVVWMESFKHQAYKKNAKVLYAGIGLGNAEDENLPLYIDQDYLFEYTGIQPVQTILN